MHSKFILPISIWSMAGDSEFEALKEEVTFFVCACDSGILWMVADSTI
jgi:hypothetical protein